MIVDYVPVLPPRPDPSGSTGPDRQSAGPRDDTFGRTLDDVLTADRIGRDHRPTTPERGRPEQAEDRGSGAADLRRDRVEGDDDDDQRPSDDESRGVSSDQDHADRVPAQDRSDQPDGEPSTDGGQPSTNGVNHAAERVSDRLDEAPANAEHGLTTALANLSGVSGAAGDVDVTEAGPDVLEAGDHVLEAGDRILGDDPLPAADDGIDPTVDVPRDVDGIESSDDASTDGETDIHPDPGDESPGTIDRPRPGGQTVADIAGDRRGAGLVETMAEMVEATTGQLGAASRAAANASPVAAVASTGARSAADIQADDATAGQVTADQITAGESTVDAAGSNPQTAPEGDELEPVPEGGDAVSTDNAPADTEVGASTLEAPSPAGGERQPSTTMAVGPNRASVTAPGPSSTSPTQQTPAPELAELQTTGLAERLRPAFAAVRRGLNGLDELRLRIQDDNAGPIKVDIATVDNRVRVLLSAGNDELMRHLGQERDRLADELRRAGFEQASIDIASDHEGRRRSPYDTDGTPPTRGRTGTGGAADAARTGGLEEAAARRGRQTTGLDLDL